MQQAYSDSAPLPWICPRCFIHLANPSISQEQAKVLLQKHAKSCSNASQERKAILRKPISQPSHEKAVNQTLNSHASSPPLQRNLYWCTVSGCNWQGVRTELDRHISQAHNGNWKTNVPVKRFPFELLPPGSWTIQQVVQHYRKISQTAGIFRNVRIDFSRIRAIENLNPTACYVGKESWLGYVVFEFSEVNGVVLECPVKNNATYVIAGDWKSMI